MLRSTVVMGMVLGVPGFLALSQTADWTVAGQGLSNLRYQPAEKTITAQNVARLGVKWVFTTGADVSATPTVSDGVVYAPDAAGNLYAVDASTGKAVWSRKISSYEAVPNVYSRVSPAVYQDELIIGDNILKTQAHSGAHVMAIGRSNGALLWNTQVDAHPAAIITGSPVVANGVVYVGVSSLEEGLAEQTGYACCTFRGSVVALSASTGEKLWQTYMTPDNGGKTGAYSGAAIWGNPAVYPAKNLLYVATGNNYTVPARAEQCEAYNLSHKTNKPCVAANDYFDAVVALDMTTGEVRWAHRSSIYDASNLACHLTPPGPNCPSPDGEDYDFGGGGPNLLGNTVGAGQKSGYYYTFDALTGKPVWATPVGPGGPLGGVLWGTSSDGARIYVAIANSKHVAWKLSPSGPSVTWGFWTALDRTTGKILWQTPDPTSGTLAISSMSVANGLLYVGSFDKVGHMYAINAATGQVLWKYSSGGSVLDAPSIVSGMLFWGSGYNRFGIGTGNNKLYAFELQ